MMKTYLFKSVQDAIPVLNPETRPFIDGRFIDTQGLNRIEKFSPIDNSPLPSISACDEILVRSAVKAAQDSFNDGSWSGKSIESRREVIVNACSLISENKYELAYLDTLETGRPINNFLNQSIPKALQSLKWFAEAADKTLDHLAPAAQGHIGMISREPIGAIGIIVPWNDPMVVTAWKLGPALMMGNSVVMKPAEQSTYSALKLAKLFKDAGLPPGVLNVVTGDGNTGEHISRDNTLQGIFFTGSTKTGMKILSDSGQTNMKKVGLECGGKSPCIVFNDARDLTRIASCVAENIFYNQGQICSAPSRLIVHKDIKDKLIGLLAKEAYCFVPGDPLDTKGNIGSLVSEKQFRKVTGFVDEAKAIGGRIIQPNTSFRDGAGPYSVMPTIIDGVSPSSSVAQEEIFGPVICVFEFSDENHAVSLANDTKFGLAAAVWSSNMDRCHRVARQIKAGLVHINGYGNEDNTAPFGGYKQSGLGRDKSILAFHEYCEMKTTWITLHND